MCYYDGKADETPAARAIDVEDETVRIDLWEKSFEKTWKETDTSGKDRTDININAQDAGYLTMKVCKLFTKDCYAKFCLHNDFESSFTLHAETEKEFRPAPRELFTANMGRIRTPVYLIWIVPKLRLYGYLEAYGRADLDFAAHLNRYDAVTFEYANQEWNVSYGGNTDTGVDVAKLSLKGTAEVGVQPEIMLSINGFETGIGLSSRFGCKKEADFYFDAVKYFDTGTYDAIKDSEVRTYNTYSLSAFAQIGIFKASKPGEIKIAKIEEHTGTDYLVPKFSELYKQNIDDNTRSVVLAVDNNVVLPMNISLGLYDKNDELIYEVDDGDIYDGTDHKYAYYLNNVDAYPGCKAYPIIRFGEIEMRATPAIDFNVHLVNARFDRAECIGAHYEPDLSSHNVIDVRFYALLEDLIDVEEWGLYFGGEEYYPFSDVSNVQSMDLSFAAKGDEDGITLDYLNFVFEINSFVCVYVKKRNSDGSISIVQTPFEPFNVCYNKKPSMIYSDPKMTRSEFKFTIGVQDSQGNFLGYGDLYDMEYTYKVTFDGAFWISRLQQYDKSNPRYVKGPFEDGTKQYVETISNYLDFPPYNRQFLKWYFLELYWNVSRIPSNVLKASGGNGGILNLEILPFSDEFLDDTTLQLENVSDKQLKKYSVTVKEIKSDKKENLKKNPIIIFDKLHSDINTRY